jgi:hypothetical protein
MKRVISLIAALPRVATILLILIPWANPSAESLLPTGEIVFTRRDGDQSNVYRMNADGSNVTLIFKNTDLVNPNSLYPHWSDDGERILFSAVKDGEFRLFSASPDGKDVKIEPGVPRLDVQSKPPDGLDVDLDDLYYKSPTGKRIKLFHSHAYRPKNQDDDGSSIGEVSWGPDRQWVLFDACERAFLFSKNPCHIFIASIDGKQHKDLGPGIEGDWKSGTGDR